MQRLHICKTEGVKKILAIVVIVLVCSTLNAQKRIKPVKAVRGLTLLQAITSIRPSVIQIIRSIIITRDDKPVVITQPIGTGFIVHPSGYVITANHVLAPPKGGQTYQDLIGLPLKNARDPHDILKNFRRVDFQIVEKDEEHDLVLLKLTGSGPQEVSQAKSLYQQGVELKEDEVVEGLPVAVSGYPFFSAALITTSGRLAASGASDVIPIQIPVPGGYDLVRGYIADLRTNPGNSGGPVYLIETGRIIGVSRGFLPTFLREKGNDTNITYNSGLAVIVPAKYVFALMKKHSLLK